MRHYYFRLILGIVFAGCLLISLFTAAIPFALLYLFLSASFLYSAYSIYRRQK